MQKEICVSAASLGAPDDGDTLVPPEVGDAVAFQVEGKVTRMEGDKAYVTLDTANGEALPDDMPMPEPSLEDEGAMLRREIAGMEGMGGY